MSGSQRQLQEEGAATLCLCVLVSQATAGLDPQRRCRKLRCLRSTWILLDTGVDSSRSYLVGVDYSRSIDYYRKLTLQLEYLGIQPGNLDPTVKANLLNLDGDDHQLDLLTASVVYPIDDFSSVSSNRGQLDDGSFWRLRFIETLCRETSISPSV